MLIELMRSVLFPDDKQLRFNWLNLLYDRLDTDTERHDFLQTGIESPAEAQDLLKEYRLDLPLEDLYHLPLYAFFERCIHALHIDKNADGFVFELMDVVLDFSLKPLPTKLNFLEFWDEKQDSLSVSGSPSDAIRVMTVHKSKGLEFPVVIFPWANQDTYIDRDALAWLENEEFQTPFDRLLVSPKSNVIDFGPKGEELYHTHRNRLELDQLNILYVALTRAKEQLHIISEQVEKPGKAITSYQNLICNYLHNKGEWSSSNYSYHYGKPVSPVKPGPSQEHEVEVDYSSEIMSFERLFTVSAKAEMWRRGEEQAVAFGTSLHELLAEIQDAKDIEAQVDHLASLTEEENSDQQQTIQWLRDLGSHPETAPLFNGSDEIWTEKEILVPNIGSIRPDRVNLHPDGSATVTDYKTGRERQDHHEQLKEYSRILDEMGIRVKKRLIIYFTSQGLSVIMV
jgi:ATP-dependent exoDNAse (exonuclease V) beta subunit